jgi:iron complex outermembrane receptor protein
MLKTPFVLTLLAAASLVSAQSPVAVSEKDFLDDMPVVLSVSRLPQRLDETPGAVTLLDRDFIRRSGARDVADLLRLVPGFQSSTSFEPDAPQASYHGAFGQYSARIQVLVDGRSVYSTYFFGSVALGLMSVALEDIERIEVLRGSNSAAYGARAMLGVVNIVTRHSADTLGVQAKLTAGGNGVRDARAALGWATNHASHRLSIDTRGDDGLDGANGHNRVQRLNVRSDWAVSPSDAVRLSLGTMDIGSGRGLVGNPDNPVHDRTYTSSFVHMDWHRTLGVDEDVAWSLSHTREAYRDSAPYSLASLRAGLVALGLGGGSESIDLDVSGTAQNNSLTFQHTFRRNADLRLVWGAEWRREQVQSLPVYNTSESLVTDYKRLFTNVEWRLAPSVLMNAGLMAEHCTDSGSSLAPRLMFNWHLLPGQTLRAGVASAFRPPSPLEKRGDIRYSYMGALLRVVTLARGNISPEQVRVQELGYLGDFPQWGASVDVRAFNEEISGFVTSERVTLVPDPSLLGSKPWNYTNTDRFAIQGFEYQFKWRPWTGAQLGFNQAYAHLNLRQPSAQGYIRSAVPDVVSTLMFTQRWASGLEATVTHQDSGSVSLQGSGSHTPSISRTDFRLSKALQWGQQRGELALVVQNLGEAYLDFDRTFSFQRRAFVTLRLDN